MNDRFKFRMWSTHAGRYFDETNDAMFENVFECMKQQICYDCQNPVFRKIYDRIAYNHIADGMVFEQCTGLKDKNGKLIYEGDIVKINGWWDACGPAGYDKNQTIVKWNKEFAGFEPMCIYDCDCGVYHNAEECEIIGNIHENKELLDE